MALDDRAVDGLEVDDAGEAREVALEPRQDPPVERGYRLRVNRPIVEGALDAREARGVPPPECLAVAQRYVGADVLAGEVGHPHVTRLQRRLIVREGLDHSPARAHAAHVVDWL